MSPRRLSTCRVPVKVATACRKLTKCMSMRMCLTDSNVDLTTCDSLTKIKIIKIPRNIRTSNNISRKRVGNLCPVREAAPVLRLIDLWPFYGNNIHIHMYMNVCVCVCTYGTYTIWSPFPGLGPALIASTCYLIKYANKLSSNAYGSVCVCWCVHVCLSHLSVNRARQISLHAI